MKRISMTAAVIVFAVILSIGLTACVGKKYDTLCKAGDVAKKTALTVDESGEFKIMQLTDLHLTSGGTYDKDNQTLRWVEEAIDKAQPDLVMVTGDTVGGGVKGRDAGILALANIFESKQVYWAYTFGNHDGEHSVKENGDDWWIGKEGKRNTIETPTLNAKETKELFYGDNTKGNLEIYELLKGYEYSLLARSEEEIADPDAMGVGNYVIELTDGGGNTVFAIFAMDTHGKMYVDPVNYSSDKGEYDRLIDAGYVGLTEKQVEWYESKVKDYSERNIRSALFMHVPNYGFRQLFEAETGLNKYGIPQFTERAAVAYWMQENIPDKYAGIDFVKNEGIYGPRWDEGLFDVMTRYKSTNLISVGHDHNNSFVIEHTLAEDNDILLGYGRTSGVNAWSRDIPIGATIYTVHTDKSDTVEMYDVEIIWPTFKYAEYGNR